MINVPSTRARLGIAFGVVGVFTLTAAVAEVSVAPKLLTYSSHGESHSVILSNNGAPVPASAIGQVKLMVDNHDYDHMIKVMKADGQITVTPTDALEMGTYTLLIDTSNGKVMVPFYATLYTLEELLASHAKTSGMTSEQIMKSLGITKPAGRDRIDLGIAPLYYTGQMLDISLNPDASRQFVWRVNGQIVKEGTGPNTFTYTFEKPGLYNVHYQELSGGVVVAEDSQVVDVRLSPAKG